MCFSAGIGAARCCDRAWFRLKGTMHAAQQANADRAQTKKGGGRDTGDIMRSGAFARSDGS